MKSKIFTVVFLTSILFSVSVIAVLWTKNNELKKELIECARYKTFFEGFNGIVCSVAPVKKEDVNKPLYFERHIDGTVLSFPVAENSAGLKDGGKIFILGKCMLFQGKRYDSVSNVDFRRYPYILNYHQPVQLGEYFVKFGNYGLTTDFKQLSPKENGIRLTFADSKDSKASLKKHKISETLQNFLIAVQIPDYKPEKTKLNKLEHQAESLRLVTLEY